jgi:predicted signal transduction protein with EAL and GGDEF domain
MLRGYSGTITVALHRGHRAAVPARSWRHRLRLVSADGPEVIKLATALIQAPLSSETARIGAAIMGHRERMGTLIIAEGIETDRHFEQAMAWGATMGQGLLFGHPAPLPFQINTVAWSAPDVMSCGRVTFETSSTSSPRPARAHGA